MDGLTGAVQERMIAEAKTKSGHMMLNMNLWSIAYVAIGKLLHKYRKNFNSCIYFTDFYCPVFYNNIAFFYN